MEGRQRHRVGDASRELVVSPGREHAADLGAEPLDLCSGVDEAIDEGGDSIVRDPGEVVAD